MIGCGTSLFIAQAYASLRERAGLGETDAFAASEIPPGRHYDVAVAISRSGTTTEVVRALRPAGLADRTVAIVAVDGTPVAAGSGHGDRACVRRRALGRPDPFRPRAR